MTKEFLGVNWQGLEAEAFCGDQKWKLKKLAYAQKTVDKVLGICDKYDKTVKEAMTGKITDTARYRIWLETTAQILTLCLENFDYKSVANKPDSGPGMLGELAGEVRDFILRGGPAGAQRLQTRLSMAREISQNISPTSKE